jgi:hypothetical protein
MGYMWIPLAPLEPTTGAFWVPRVYAYIIISLLTVWGAYGDYLKMASGWVTVGVRRHPSDIFRTPSHNLPCTVRKASGVCAQWVAEILTPPPSPGSLPCVICMSGWSVFLDSVEQRKVGSMPCGRQGHIKLRMCYWSRAVHPLRNK